MNNEPIIKSLLDTDFYKFTMGQIVFHRFKEIPVKYFFKNRTKGIPLAEIISEETLRQELDNVRTLKFNNSELHYLRGTNEYGDRMFSEDYLQFLKNLELPPYELKRFGDSYKLEFAGPWSKAIYWEIYALAIINELYYRAQMKKLSSFQKDTVYATGTARLAKKIKTLKEYHEITFTDFGTRRRFSREWQDYVVSALAHELPETQFRGTSNVYLAMKHGLLPMGTSAHEMFMIMSGLVHGSDKGIRQSHSETLYQWWKAYGHGLSIALTDTYGSEFFFKDMTPEQAREWKGLRQDSGDPLEFGDNAISFYEKHGIDPKEKIIVFSDGLDVENIIRISQYFYGHINTTFGWGTNLTNDLGFKALSLIIKPSEACGRGLVKLSDNLAKALGKPEDVERFKRIFGYTSNLNQECKY